MNTKLLLIALIIAGLSSCSTVYKIEQTPDDVYYSPTPRQDSYVQLNTGEDRNVYNNSSVEDREDREVLRRVNNRRWRKRHYDYGYDYPYGYGIYPYGYNNNYPVYVDPKGNNSSSTYKGPRKYNLGTYTKPAVTYTTDPKTGKIINVPNSTIIGSSSSRTFTKPSSNGSGVGNFIRKVLTTGNSNSNTYNNTNSTTQSRTFEPSRNSSNNNSSSSSAGKSSSSSSSAPVRTFRK